MRASRLSKFLSVPLTFLPLCSLGLRAQTVTVRPEAGPFDPAKLSMETPPPQGFAVRAGRMFDAKAGRNLTNQVILVKDGRIADVGPADRVQIPQGAKVIDLSRATVLPGLIDRHVHLMQDAQPNEARLAFIGTHYALKNLYAGFTTLQDMNSPATYATVELRDAINRGQVPGPRLQVSGPGLDPRGATYYAAPSGPGPFGRGGGIALWQNVQDINSPWLARAVVREHSH
jgi:amidohydrolase family protein